LFYCAVRYLFGDHLIDAEGIIEQWLDIAF